MVLGQTVRYRSHQNNNPLPLFSDGLRSNSSLFGPKIGSKDVKLLGSCLLSPPLILLIQNHETNQEQKTSLGHTETARTGEQDPIRRSDDLDET